MAEQIGEQLHELTNVYPAPLELGNWIWLCSCGHADNARDEHAAHEAWQEHVELASRGRYV